MINFSQLNIRSWSKLGPCGAFGIAALELAENYKQLVMLTADLCTFSGLNRFKESYPESIYNLGIAEQNMLGVAGGLAREGFIPFATSYAAFASLRCADQIKVLMAYMNLPIKLVGLTSGFSVGVLGATHMCLEDMAIMRALPNITILSPADCAETIKAAIAAAEQPGPVYIRLTGSMNNPIVYNDDYQFEIGKSIILKEGGNISIISTGSMVSCSLKVAELLENEGISSDVINMHTISPIDKEIIKQASGKSLIVTVEEHSIVGGLGSAVSEVLALMKRRPPHLLIGARSTYPHAADYKDLLEKNGLTAPQIAQRITAAYKELS